MSQNASQENTPASGIPRFSTLPAERMGTQSLLFGGFASILFCGLILVLLGSERTQHLANGGHFQLSPQFPDMIPAPPAMITVSWLPARAASGSPVMVTVRVTSTGKPFPVGKVRIYDGITVLGVGEIQNGTVILTGRLPYTPRHLIRATYTGDAYHFPVSSVAENQFTTTVVGRR